MKYYPTIGMEIHAELKTASKMFCACKNDPDNAPPNTHICPVCLAHPGALPTINKEAVRAILRIGVAVGGELADFSEFDRKNYFYPDLPKGYQISQYKYPLVSGGELAGVALTRIHLEEDTARSVHDKGEETLIDFNRGGVPLMELVSEPVIHEAKQAADFARELQLLLRTLGVSEASMEKGQMRVEANISVSPDPDTLGTKVEVKNLNSFRSVERAIEYEIKRQIQLLEAGEQVRQQTRGWNEQKQQTFPQRSKEEAADYRYFPEPDLPKLHISEIPEFAQEALRASLPELPWEYRERLAKDYRLSAETTAFLVQNPRIGAFFERVVASLDGEGQFVGNVFLNDIPNELLAHEALDTVQEGVTTILRAWRQKELISTTAVSLLKELLTGALAPEALAEALAANTQQSDTDALTELAQAIIAEYPEVVAEFKEGKEKALMFLVGKGMQKSKGTANPQLLAEILRQELAKK